MCSIYYSYNIYSKTSHLQSKKTLQAFPTLDYTEKKCRQKQLSSWALCLSENWHCELLELVAPPSLMSHTMLRHSSFGRRFFSIWFLLKCLVVSAQVQKRVPDLHWYPATATWYGDPEGDGSTGRSHSPQPH